MSKEENSGLQPQENRALSPNYLVQPESLGPYFRV